MWPTACCRGDFGQWGFFFLCIELLEGTYPGHVENVEAAVAKEIIAGKLANSVLRIELDFADCTTTLGLLVNRRTVKRKA